MKFSAKLALLVCFLCTISWRSFAYGDQLFETLYLNTDNLLTSLPIAGPYYVFGNPDLSETFSGHIYGGTTLSGVPVYIHLRLGADNTTGPTTTGVFTITLYKNLF